MGELEEQNLYEDEREILAEEDEDDSTPIDEESEFLEVRSTLILNRYRCPCMELMAMPMMQSSPKSRQDDEDEDDNFDYEDRVFSVMKARGKKLDSFEDTNFNHSDPGISEVRRFFLSGIWSDIPSDDLFF